MSRAGARTSRRIPIREKSAFHFPGIPQAFDRKDFSSPAASCQLPAAETEWEDDLEGDMQITEYAERQKQARETQMLKLSKQDDLPEPAFWKQEEMHLLAQVRDKKYAQVLHILLSPAKDLQMFMRGYPASDPHEYHGLKRHIANESIRNLTYTPFETAILQNDHEMVTLFSIHGREYLQHYYQCNAVPICFHFKDARMLYRLIFELQYPLESMNEPACKFQTMICPPVNVHQQHPQYLDWLRRIRYPHPFFNLFAWPPSKECYALLVKFAPRLMRYNAMSGNVMLWLNRHFKKLGDVRKEIRERSGKGIYPEALVQIPYLALEIIQNLNSPAYDLQLPLILTRYSKLAEEYQHHCNILMRLASEKKQNLSLHDEFVDVGSIPDIDMRGNFLWKQEQYWKVK